MTIPLLSFPSPFPSLCPSASSYPYPCAFFCRVHDHDDENGLCSQSLAMTLTVNENGHVSRSWKGPVRLQTEKTSAKMIAKATVSDAASNKTS